MVARVAASQADLRVPAARAGGIDDLESDRITAIEGPATRANTEREAEAARTRSGDAGPTLRDLRSASAGPTSPMSQLVQQRQSR